MTTELEKISLNVAGAEIEMLQGGQGKPLLFLHGGEGPVTYSAEYLKLLAKNYRIYAPWHPGFGHSERPKSFRKFDDIVYFYLDLIGQLKLETPILAGASFGGWLACELAIRSPDSFSHLLLSAPLGIKVGGREDRDITDLYLVGTADWPQYFVANENLRPKYSELTKPELLGIARARESLTLYGWEPYMHNPVLKRWLHRITIPTLIVSGDQDRMVSAGYSESYASLIPGSRFEVLKGAGHLACVDKPKEFVELAHSFLSGSASSRLAS